MSTNPIICYLNGVYQPLSEARISPLDRGFLFGDAVYEVIPVYGGRPFRLREHLDRLNRSLAGIRMPPPRSHVEWEALCRELVTRNGAADCYVYLQVSRGAEAARNHAWNDATSPTLFAYATALEPLPAKIMDQGVAAVTAPDIRWARRDIKSTALLANVLMKKLAVDAGAFETLMIEDGVLTEGSSTTVHVITNGVIHTPPNGRHILPGTTREVVTELAVAQNLPINHSPVPETLLRSADEIWLSFATRGVLPVTQLDGQMIGKGKPGQLWKRIHAAFVEYVTSLAGTPPL